MKISGIYKIQSKIKPEKIYIGSSQDINKRWKGHLIYLKENKHHNRKLQNHFNKYGESDLSFSILLGCPEKDLIKIEQYFLDSYKPWFNILLCAGSPRGHRWKHSIKARQKMSIAKIGKPSPRKGKTHTKEAKEKNRQSHLGKKQSLEHIRKRSEAEKGRTSPMKGKHHSEETKQKMRDTIKMKKLIV